MMRYFSTFIILIGLVLIVYGWVNRPSTENHSSAVALATVIETAIIEELSTHTTTPSPTNRPPTATSSPTASVTPSITPTPSETPLMTLVAGQSADLAQPTRTLIAENEIAINDTITTTIHTTATAFPTRVSANTEVITTTAQNNPSPVATIVVSSETDTPTAEPINVTPTAAPSMTPLPIVVTTNGSVPPPPTWERFGVTLPYGGALAIAYQQNLQFGSYLNWGTSATNSGNYWQMIRTSQNGYKPSGENLDRVITSQPGSYWLIGNEMDVVWQDNVTPGRYVEIYHELYWYIKSRDPSAKIGIGGVSQPTPLRRAYLDQILTIYQQNYGTAMPIDVWNVHAFILREEAGSWGAGIPPGMGGTGELYEVSDHTDIDIFRQNIIDFRAWMAQRGYQDRPLVVSEYGVLMPSDYGFPPEHVASFMTQTFDFFLTAANGTGYPPDGGRLVQWWFWYSLYDPNDFPSGNLVNLETNQLTAVGVAYRDYPK